MQKYQRLQTIHGIIGKDRLRLGKYDLDARRIRLAFSPIFSRCLIRDES